MVEEEIIQPIDFKTTETTPNYKEIIEKNEFKITIGPQQRTIRDVVQDVVSGRIEVQPEFQRKYIWTPDKVTKLIETILRGASIPEIWLAECEHVKEKDGKKVKWEVIDGQQRLQSLAYIVTNVIKFAGFSNLYEGFNGFLFKDLPEELQDKILYFQLRFAIIKGHEYDPSIRNYFFRILNMNMRILRKQELRNCQYAGKYNDLLRRLAESRLAEFNIYERKRFEDVVLVLKVLALSESYKNYSREHELLDTHMEKMNDKYEKMDVVKREEEFMKISDTFTRTLQLAKSIFGKNVFFLPQLSEQNQVIWKPIAGRISGDSFVVTMIGLISHLSYADKIVSKARKIKIAYGKFISEALKNVYLFQGKSRLINVLDGWNSILDTIIGE